MGANISRSDRIPSSLNSRAIELITDICFIPDTPYAKSASILVFSYPEFDQIAQELTSILDASTKTVVISGASTPVEGNPPPLSKAEEIMRRIDSTKYPHINFILETKSTNAKEHVLFSAPSFSAATEILYLVKEHTSGRFRRTLEKNLPNKIFLQKSFTQNTFEQNLPVSRSSWYLTEEGKRLVWNELLKIYCYGIKGDVMLDSGTHQLFGLLEAQLNQRFTDLAGCYKPNNDAWF